MRGRVVGVAIVSALSASAGLFACATGGITDDTNAPDSSNNDSTTPPNDSGPTGDGSPATCTSPQVKCGTTCVNEKTDPQHCGGCDASCASGDSCDGGACIPGCTSAQKLCTDGGLFCANVQSDNGNCGDCNAQCTGGWTCQAGRCLPNCTGGQTLCDIDGSADGGPPFCTDTNTDNSNCGSCDNPCTSSQYCDAGGCVNNPSSATCKTVNGLLWCYHPGTCGEACNTVCSYFGKTPVADQTKWLDAQSSSTSCQALATAFNNVSTPSLASYSYACAEVNGTSNDSGTLTGQIYCSSYASCPASHLTMMDGIGNACSSAAWISLCPCE